MDHNECVCGGLRKIIRSLRVPELLLCPRPAEREGRGVEVMNALLAALDPKKSTITTTTATTSAATTTTEVPVIVPAGAPGSL